MESIHISVLGERLAEKAKEVRKTKEPQLHTMYLGSIDENVLTDIMWYDGESKSVKLEILDPLDLETKHIFKINFNGRKK